MSNLLVFSALGLYILLLVLFTRLVKTKGDNNAFFRAGRRSPWLLVAFGMIGASISGVSLVSVPGWVHQNGMTYIQMCLGFFAGFVCIAFLLLPLYYRLRLTSIYGYLAERFGRRSHLTGACFFLLSKLTGAAARLFLTCTVLHEMAIRPLGLPFAFTVGVVLLAIFLYTRKGGIENIVVERVRAQVKDYAFYCDMLGSVKWGGELAQRRPSAEALAAFRSSPSNVPSPDFRTIMVSDVIIEDCKQLVKCIGLPERPLCNVLLRNVKGCAQ